MSDLFLTADNIDINKFRKKYPNNILNISKQDIFKKDDEDDFIPNELYSDFEIYDQENYDQVIKDQYKKEQGVDYDYNALFEYNKTAFKKQISENLGQVSITRDPNITKFDDTYSLTPYATYMMTPLSGGDMENVVSRFDNCVGRWRNKNKDKHCKDNKPCKKYTKEFEIFNDYTGDDCRDEDGNILEDGDRKRVYCNHRESLKCSGHGTCKHSKDGKCVCKDGYTGPNCKTPPSMPSQTCRDKKATGPNYCTGIEKELECKNSYDDSNKYGDEIYECDWAVNNTCGVAKQKVCNMNGDQCCTTPKADETI